MILYQSGVKKRFQEIVQRARVHLYEISKLFERQLSFFRKSTANANPSEFPRLCKAFWVISGTLLLFFITALVIILAVSISTP